MRKFAWVAALVLGIGWGLACPPRAQAVITRLTPLRDVLAESQFILTVKVDKLDPESLTAVLLADEDLKGKLASRKLPVSLKGDSEAAKDNHTPQLLKRLAPNLPVVLFVNQRGPRYTAFAYTNGTWFQMIGQKPDDSDTVRWGFTHCEPYLRRTFKGTTAEMKQVIIDGLSGKKNPPEVDPKEPPGFGPEVEKPKEEGKKQPECQTNCDYSSSSHQGPLFAVIPTVLIGGPLAILAVLFPTLFGGVLLLFRRWLAFFSVVATNSTILFLHYWFADSWVGSWWGTQTALLLTMTVVTLLGTLWASRRYSEEDLPPAPRTESLVLGLLSATCLMGVVYYLVRPPSRLDVTWSLLLIFASAVWVATLFKGVRQIRSRSGKPRCGITIESVLLWVMLLALTGFAVARPGAEGVIADPTAAGEGRPTARFEEDAGWMKVFQENGRGMIVSSPLVVGERIYVAAAHQKALETFGVVYCLDRNTQEVIWTFDNDGDMKQIFSSPRLADGRIYIGEGFHTDPNCRLYCLDAKTGKLCWPPFQTGSQTESSPCISEGKVYFGAGNDGLYALDAITGKKLWQFPERPTTSPLLRVCGNPAVAKGRLFTGSGIDRERPQDPGETAVFALDATTGKLLWKVPVNLPCWAEPVPLGERVLFALGNGDLFQDAYDKPAGAILCLNAATGEQVWRVEVPNAVIEKPAVDSHRIYFGSRDGHCYCLARTDGQELWKKDLGAPVVASVALDASTENERTLTANLYAITMNGWVYCLDPYTGKIHWSHGGLEQYNATICSAPTVVVSSRPGGDRRTIYFGAALHNLSVPALFGLKDLLPDR